jgi:DUF1680 family protein
MSTRGRVVDPSPSAPFSRLHPLSGSDSTVDGAFWGARLQNNRLVSLPEAHAQLQEHGALPYLCAAASGATEPPQLRSFGPPTFYTLLDSDIFKWLEAVAYEEIRLAVSPSLRRAADEAIALIEAAQKDDGFINSWTVLHGADATMESWRTSFVPYCGAHLIQAGVAWNRAFGEDRLLRVAVRMADFLARAKQQHPAFVPLHPGLEMALVELYRETGELRHLELARAFIDDRGYDNIGWWKFTPDRYADDIPLRESQTIHGHAVMALYLLCGMADVAVETGDEALLAATEGQWDDFVATKMYITGGAGATQYDEAFGKPYELSPDTAYAETCASVASIMLSWRLLLATGRSRYADLIERTLYNGLLAGGSLDGHTYFYVNPLHVREAGQVLSPDGYGHRKPWFECACCPPNLMRSLSTLGQLAYTADADGIQLHQFLDGTLRVAEYGRALFVESGVPFGDGILSVTVTETDEQPWTLAIRVPEWSDSPTLVCSADGGDPVAAVADEQGYVRVERVWRAGDQLKIDTAPEFTVLAADPRMDAYRGQRAVMRGPLVYCVEGVDLGNGITIDEIRLPKKVELTMTAPAAELLNVPSAAVALTVAEPPIAGSPAYARPSLPRAVGTVALSLVPYLAWGNRGATTMRVWIPERDAE